MPENDLLKRYLDAGMAFTQMTRERAEAIIKDFVKAGEIPRKRANESIEELVERSRKNTEALVTLIQDQIKDQLGALGIATKDDIARLERKIAASGSSTAKKSPAKKSTAKKASAAKKSS